MRIYIDTYVYTYICIYVHIHMHVYIHMYIYIFTYKHTYVCFHIYTLCKNIQLGSRRQSRSEPPLGSSQTRPATARRRG